MSKTYIFAIGGTGSRVLKSLIFLLAAGTECKSGKIVPIIIDPDSANADLSRTVSLINSYQKIRRNLTFNSDIKNQFYKTEVESVNDNFLIKIENSNKKFKEFINYNSLDDSNKSLMSILFSSKNLEAEMEVGFKGNPNIGSIVLNQFHQSLDYQSFASSFQQGDRIFIVSSIFGGTGAAGFPLLLKNLREPASNIANSAIIKDSDIGALSVLPYFGVKHDPEATVDSKTFISKTKSALKYYQQNVNSSVNSIYYIGDSVKKHYDNNEGSTKQKNDAHFVELAGALAILDFINSEVSGIYGKVKEFGIKSYDGSLIFNDFYDKTRDSLFEPLTQFHLSALLIKNKIKKYLGTRFAADIKLNSNELKGEFFMELNRFIEYYWDWLIEMARNEISFSPFDLNQNPDNPFDVIKGVDIKDGKFFGAKGYERYLEYLNKNSNKGISHGNVPTFFMELNYLASNQLINA